MNQRVEISYRTILFTLMLLASLWLVFQIKDIIFLLVISYILMSAFRPVVDWLEKHRIPRVFGILLTYAVVFGVFGASIASVIPSLVNQVVQLIKNLPQLIERVLPYWNIDERSLTSQVAPLSENVVRVTVNLFNNIFTMLSIMVFTFYFLLEHHHTKQLLARTVGNEIADTVVEILRDIERKLSYWVNGQLILMVFVGVLTYIGLIWLRVEFALPLAILAGLFEIVPIIGPFVSAIPAVFIALTISPFFAVVVAGFYFLIQQIENNILVPLVMRRSTGLPPLLTILALMVGSRLAGLMGMILAVPVVLIIQSVLEFYLIRSGEQD